MGKLFSYNLDIRKNAYLNWRTQANDPAHNLHVLASDYADGAVVLINAVLKDNSDKKADSLIMPILYSIDQSIELFLKTIIRLIDEQSGDGISNYKSHDIAELKQQMVAKIKKVEKKTAGLEKHLKPVTEFIDELYVKIKQKDDNGRDRVNIDFARYPFTADGAAHFYVEEKDNVVIDVENLGERFICIRDSLEALCLMYEVKKENIEEIQGDL
ncbi:MAG: hypothetical protein FRC54_00725 [bacterium LCO1.1]|jgi:hypothetical protein|uniref:Uncharacterized protein n=1 Tax=Candidatus Weimeria bifida TaxID=2599074 RepID=A0A6N7IXR8_9FIRM|nr:hypothetical protein [Candidatus Weimeria bifida]